MTRLFSILFGKLLPATLVALVAGTFSAMADYPEKPITLVVGFSAGGGIDGYARSLASFAQDEIGVPMVVVNKPGATGMIGAKSVKEAAFDGYTLMVIGGGTLYLKSTLDGAEAPATPDDFVVLGGIGSLTTSLMVPESSPFKTVGDLIEYAKENPGELRWANPGNGSIHTMGGRVFLTSNGITAQGVPFKGGGAARVAIAGEQVDFGFVGIQLIAGFESKLRALAVTSGSPDSVYPDVPTMEQLGLPQMTVSNPVLVYGHKDIPADVVTKMRGAIENIASSDDFQQMVRKNGVEGVYLDITAVDERMKALADAVAPVLEATTK